MQVVNYVMGRGELVDPQEGPEDPFDHVGEVRKAAVVGVEGSEKSDPVYDLLVFLDPGHNPVSGNATQIVRKDKIKYNADKRPGTYHLISD